MHRQHSLSPYTRHYSHTTNPFLDLLEDPSISLDSEQTSQTASSSSSSIRVNEAAVEGLRPVLQSYLSHARSPEQGGQGTLLRLPFVTVNEYLFLLREMSAAMGPLKRRGMYYLAAAVSDFFVPNQRTPQHKIQSSKGSLVIEMDQVPKVLRPMVQSWAPAAFIVSFKLETDADILIPKAEGALERYGHQVVVANDLARRKEEVCFVSRKIGHGKVDGNGTYEAKWLRLAKGEKNEAGGVKEIEEDIVAELLKRHQAWIEEGESRGE
ncbi:Phosphopantothenoylcysteine synthetase [Microstroma glucosiphilum]|uniref:Phosphopantothenoylcysteine synthetase n=1 Tax=Pseudomicrostroma glucosiphilum TaxID=1684307 RepID=A0A316U9U8_9BASI|nr:Phosphopantothenoylcysteine synthetase [Pseudomicrostroma glucosiphilum]PWN21929.1 Phosphopantothenoylcysteine synthetase [Pseudomicrostroma glucosiphilum]